MNFRLSFLSKIFFISIFTFSFFEFLNYYIVISHCSWPEIQQEEANNDSSIKAMLLADTHLLGPYRGHWFDKLRREWQMYRAFQSAVTLHQPEVIFVLGDLLDEGLWFDEKQFKEYAARFFSLFSVPNDIKLYVVPGNHDVGFHYEMDPYLLYIFEDTFNVSSVQLLEIKGSYFVLLNSMAMEGDGCFLCSAAKKKIKKISVKLNCLKKGNCTKTAKVKKYSQPIILQHFPMYRESDLDCIEKEKAPPGIRNQLFEEDWDCLSQKSSELIYRQLNPRLIFTGHVHHGCHIVHKNNIHEYTLASFSWRNKNNPHFILAKITPTDFAVKTCDLPEESTVISIYVLVILALALWTSLLFFFEEEKKNVGNVKFNHYNEIKQ